MEGLSARGGALVVLFPGIMTSASSISSASRVGIVKMAGIQTEKDIFRMEKIHDGSNPKASLIVQRMLDLTLG